MDVAFQRKFAKKSQYAQNKVLSEQSRAKQSQAKQSKAEQRSILAPKDRLSTAKKQIRIWLFVLIFFVYIQTLFCKDS